MVRELNEIITDIKSEENKFDKWWDENNVWLFCLGLIVGMIVGYLIAKFGYLIG